MSARAYYVEGVPLVNTGAEMCEACGARKAIGHSVAGHAICPRCAGMAAVLADEYAQEVEAARLRRIARVEECRGAMGLPAPQTPKGDSASRKRSLTFHNAQKASAARRERRRVVLDALETSGRPLCVVEIRDRARVSEHTVRLALGELVAEKLVTVVNARAPRTRKPQRERLVYSLTLQANRLSITASL